MSGLGIQRYICEATSMRLSTNGQWVSYGDMLRVIEQTARDQNDSRLRGIEIARDEAIVKERDTRKVCDEKLSAMCTQVRDAELKAKSDTLVIDMLKFAINKAARDSGSASSQLCAAVIDVIDALGAV